MKYQQQRSARSTLALRALLVCLAAALLLPATDVSAKGRRAARLSQDLQDRIQASSTDSTCVIVPGTQAQVDRMATRHGLRISKRLHTGAVMDVPAGKLAALAADARVPSLSSNYRVGADMAVTNATIGADQVWVDGWAEGVEGVTGEGVGVAVIDTGVADLPELRGRIVVSMDFTATSKRSGQRFWRMADDCSSSSSGSGGMLSRAKDDNGHGTHVAGIIAAAGANRWDDTRGVAPGALIISLKVLDANGGGFASDVIEAIDWAIANRDRYLIKVLNLSLGGPVLQPYADDPVNQAVERAYRAGLVVIASAGNQGKDAEGHEILGGTTVPGNSPFAITVGALNTKQTAFRSDDELTTYSSRGVTRFDDLIKPDLVAPGNRIPGLLAPGSTLAREHPELVIDTVDGKRLELSGTSMAAAAVSGAVALILESQSPTHPEAIRHLCSTDSEFGTGHVCCSIWRRQFERPRRLGSCRWVWPWLGHRRRSDTGHV